MLDICREQRTCDVRGADALTAPSAVAPVTSCDPVHADGDVYSGSNVRQASKAGYPVCVRPSFRERVL